MKNNQFCHLHLHNEFSYLDGVGTAQEYIDKAKREGFSSIALTNHANIDGLIQWQQSCDKEGINPILGTEMYIVPDMRDKQKGEKKGHIVFLIKNEKGWKELCKIMTVANLKGFYYKPRIDFNFLLSCDLSGLIILTACSRSFLHLPKGEAVLWSLAEKKADVYIEIMPHIGREFDAHNARLLEFRYKYGLKLVATNDCHYVDNSDWESHEVLLAIQTRAKWKDQSRWKFNVTGLHLKSANQMKNSFADQNAFPVKEYISAMKNTLEIADKCESFRIGKKKTVLPPIYPEAIDEYKELWKWTTKALFDKKLNSPKYQRRLDYEMKVVKEKDFVRYFLIVGKLIDWCKINGIMTGAGRGSVGGSLIAYLMGITTVDPIKYKLLFTRFINKNRIDFPDIDMDFEDEKRKQVVDHLRERYGDKCVFGISTFLTMKGRAVLRDVARVFDVPLTDVNEFTKTMPGGGGGEDEEINNSVRLHSEGGGRWFLRKYPEVIKHATKLEGQLRGVGRHAAGVVVVPQSIDFEKGSSRGNLCIRNDTAVVNWEMKDVEYLGLVKFDLLGLNALSILSSIQKSINKKSPDFKFSDLVPEDKKIFASLSGGGTVGIFQFCTGLMTETCKKLKIESFSDMVAALALVRPGAMHSGMLDEYIRRKHGGGWKRKHPIYEKITKDTYGVLIYQEQIMQVINKVAGLPYFIADEIRKVIGKKRHASEFEPYRVKFLNGCKKTKIFTQDEAKEFWGVLLNCAQYLFNKSHSVEYAMLAYWAAWAKFYYPTKFITACLNYGGESNKQSYIDESVRLGLTVMSPKVGISGLRKWKTKGSKIYVPFIEVKGVGEKTVEQCRANQSRGFFATDRATTARSKIQKILNEINAYDLDSNKINLQYFKFSIGTNVELKIRKASFPGHGSNLARCADCSLIKECSHPVPPSPGSYNVAIIGEAPGWNEDKEREGFVGRAGKLLFKTIEAFGGRRKDFHITNVCKCYPSVSKTPNQEQIKTCSEKWLKEELIKIRCGLILCVGGSAMFALTKREGGITKMNGKIEYSAKYNCYICYVIHPAAVLRNPEQKGEFEKGVASFMATFKKNLRGDEK